MPANFKEIAEQGADGILRVSKVTEPSLTAYLPAKDKATGTAVIICPGGGYGILAMGHEGYAVAEEFNKLGVAAFVLKYRLPNDETMTGQVIRTASGPAAGHVPAPEECCKMEP